MNRLVRPSDWNRPRFVRIAVDELQQAVLYHRKLWEYVAVIEALEDLGQLDQGKSALGLGTGAEPLCFYLARRTARVTATDRFSESSDWAEARLAVESAYNQNPFPYPRERLEFRNMDMRRIDLPADSADFVWSCSSVEHVDSGEELVELFRGIAEVLKPGGYAVVTTEFNLTQTPRYLPNLVLFDEALLERVQQASGLRLISPLDLGLDDHPANVPFHLDYELLLPFHRHLPHLWLQRGDLLFTSALLAFQKDSSLPMQAAIAPLDHGLVARFQDRGNAIRRKLIHRFEPQARFTQAGTVKESGGRAAAVSDFQDGVLQFGPYAALPSGRYRACFSLRIDGLRERLSPDSPICLLELVCSEAGKYRIAGEFALTPHDLRGDPLKQAARRLAMPAGQSAPDVPPDRTARPSPAELGAMAARPGREFNVSPPIELSLPASVEAALEFTANGTEFLEFRVTCNGSAQVSYYGVELMVREGL